MELSPQSYFHETLGLTPAQIIEVAKLSTDYVSRLEFHWDLKGWRSTRYEQHLLDLSRLRKSQKS
ncbi:MAG: hypothetical protein EXR29_14730 [Betaproteobacteria bacterium]|nr:hypothetical protein [Betaproteobacteria bacterium]